MRQYYKSDKKKREESKRKKKEEKKMRRLNRQTETPPVEIPPSAPEQVPFENH